MVLCNDDALAERCRSLRNLAFIPPRRFVHDKLGYNFRMSNIQAALGVAQLEKLENTLKKKRYIGVRYQGLLDGFPNLHLPVTGTGYADNLYWVFGLVLDDDCPADAAEFEKRLHEKRVGTRPFFWPMHEQPIFLSQGWFTEEVYPVASRIARRGFYIPSGLTLTDEQIEYVANQVKSIGREFF